MHNVQRFMPEAGVDDEAFHAAGLMIYVCCWMQDAVCSESRQGVKAARTVFSKIAQLLSGHQLRAAIALAAASGNIRLATQISQV